MAHLPARSTGRATLAAVLLLTLFALPTLAGPPSPAPARSQVKVSWSAPLLWEGLLASFPSLGRVVSVWLKGGCGSDPNGIPLCGTVSLSEGGCGIDPDGRPLCGTH